MNTRLISGLGLTLLTGILSSGCNSTNATGAASAFGIPVSTTTGSSTSGDGTSGPSGCHGKNCQSGGSGNGNGNVQITAEAQIGAQGGIHLSPGHYESAISVANGTDLILDPGIYVLDDGISISGGSTLTGNGATLSIVGGVVDIAADSSVSGISIVQN